MTCKCQKEKWYLFVLACLVGGPAWTASCASASEKPSPLVTWEKLNSGTSSELSAIAFGAGKYVIAGGSGTVVFSTDTLSWRAGNTGRNDRFTSLIFGNELFVAGTYAGEIWSSTNGIDWKIPVVSTANVVRSIAFKPGLFVAVGGRKEFNGIHTSLVVTASDAATWILRDAGDNIPKSAVTMGKEQIVAVGDNGTDAFSYLSQDGKSWSRYPIISGQTGSGVSDVTGLAFGKDLFIAVGLGKILASADGIIWTKVIDTGVKYLTSVEFGGGLFVATGLEGAVYISRDGHDWSSGSIQSSQWLRNVTFINGEFFCVGDNGTLFRGKLPPVLPPYIVTQPKSQLVTEGEAAELNVIAAGSGPLGYEWRINDQVIPGQTNSVLVIGKAGVVDSGNYTVRILNSGGFITSDSAQLVVSLSGVDPVANREFATVGNPGNSEDSVVGVGKVDYVYQIGRFEVNNSQYCRFLNAKAQMDSQRFYRPEMNIARVGGPGSYVYVPALGFERKPVVQVSFYDAARFANWLHNGATESSETENGAYIIGKDGTIIRNANARYFIPSEDEWHKAAYYQPPQAGGPTNSYWTYATGNSIAPKSETPPGGTNSANYNYLEVGGAYGPLSVGSYSAARSYYGTFDQTGNVWEWVESSLIGRRRIRGGSFEDKSFKITSMYRADDFGPDNSDWRGGSVGFRVARLAPTSEQATIQSLRLSHGTFETRINATIGQGYFVDATRDLLHWSPWTNIVAQTETVVFSDFISGTNAVKFYRIRSQLIPPVIVRQPQSLWLRNGERAVFSVTVVGSPRLLYQWRFNGLDLVGEVNSVLVTMANPFYFGNYSVRISNAVGAVESDIAELELATVPVIIVHPENQVVVVGSRVSLTVEATGSPTINYQWRLNNVDIQGQTSPTLLLEDIQLKDSGSYAVVVTNPIGSATSKAAMVSVGLRLIAPPSIDGKTLRAVIGFGTEPFAETGSYRFITGPNGNYVIVRMSGDVAASSGTYKYERTGPTTARIVSIDASLGMVTVELVFSSETAGTFTNTGFGGVGRQNGTFMIE